MKKINPILFTGKQQVGELGYPDCFKLLHLEPIRTKPSDLGEVVICKVILLPELIEQFTFVESEGELVVLSKDLVDV